MKKVEVSAGIIEKDGKILCTKRSESKFDYISCKWEFPGGKVEAGETFEQALKRELIEELELPVEIESHFGDFVYQYPDFELTMHCYICLPQSDELKLNVHKDYVWAKKEELSSIDFAPADVVVVEKILQN